MKINAEQLDTLYKSYGYEIDKKSDDIRVYLYKKSRYFGAEIIPLIDSDNIEDISEQIKQEYSSSGYAATIKNIQSIDQADISLFKSFFSYESTSNRLKKKYELFVEKQNNNLLGNKYEYIESPFEMVGEDTADNKLFSIISTIFEQESADLIVIEASAGYGKTCTAYETLKLLANTSNDKLPIFTELSRNRGAKIFRYILLDEIDIEYPSLNSELVIKEIKKGRIPLIIDGFDELLYKADLNDSDDVDSFEEIETMLDTIGSLLDGNTKVILTTRRTAIFNGLEFDKWANKWDAKFNVTRISIKEPRIKDWLGDDRFIEIKDNAVPIQYIANPVILTFLKNVGNNDFKELIEHPEMLIKQYFDKMLEREKERQNLIISADDQYEIFKNVVRLLIEFDFTTESKDFFKEIIKDQNSKLLENTRSLYSGIKPSLDNLVDSLATHALLDRKGRDENQIGFINDFVLGIFIGDIICESSTEKLNKDFSTYMIELAVTAFKVQSREKKIILWEKLNVIRNRFLPFYIFTFDIFLRECLMKDYTELTVYDLNFYGIKFENYAITNSVFIKCLFKRCIFDVNQLKGVSFVDCRFDACIIVNSEYLDTSDGISLIKCKQENCFVLSRIVYPISLDKEQLSQMEVDILKCLLDITRTKGHHIMQLMHCFEKTDYKKVSHALEILESKDLVVIKGNHINFNINKMKIIKQTIHQNSIH